MVGSRASRECADTLNNSTGTTEVTHRLARRTTGRTDLTPTLRDVSSDAPEVPTTSDTNARAVLARRVEVIMIGIGGGVVIPRRGGRPPGGGGGARGGLPPGRGAPPPGLRPAGPPAPP